MSIPGLERYPELQKKFRRRYAEAGRDRKCPKCARRRVVQRFREMVAVRQRRDK